MDLLGLPAELILEILFGCGPRVVATGVRLTCRYLNVLTHDDNLWYRFRAPLCQPPPTGRSVEFMYLIEHCGETEFRTVRRLIIGPATYTGEAKNGTACGWGIWRTGTDTHIGEWVDGKCNGFVSRFSDKESYQGRYVNDMRDGLGTQIWEDGDRYTGQWSCGSESGYGEYTWANGSRYRGTWSSDMRSGFGIYTWAKPCFEDVYIGGYKDSTRHGFGRYIFSDGREYIGEWENNLRNGNGDYRFPDGTRYIGNFVRSLRHGTGAIILPDGTIHYGDWINDMPNNPNLVNNRYNGLFLLDPHLQRSRIQEIISSH